MLWWLFLCLSTILNIIFLYRSNPDSEYSYYSKILSILYITSTSLRAIFPRIDVERICYFDTFISSTFIGRLFATFGEIAFALQITITLMFFCKQLNLKELLLPLYLFPIWITIAQVFCWTGVITKKQSYHCIEETIWTLSVIFLIIPTMLIIYVKTKNQNLKQGLLIAIILSVCYVIFMITYDIPMYYKRYLKDEKNGIKYLNFTEGVKDSMFCKKVSREWKIWKEDSYWMLGYFSIGTLISIFLIEMTNN